MIRYHVISRQDETAFELEIEELVQNDWTLREFRVTYDVNRSDIIYTGLLTRRQTQSLNGENILE